MNFDPLEKRLLHLNGDILVLSCESWSNEETYLLLNFKENGKGEKDSALLQKLWFPQLYSN